LRLTFVKHLAQVNDKGEVVRLTARWDDLPAPAKPTLEKFVNERLLIRSGNQDEGKAGQGSVSVEVAHEAMFRCWNDLKGWLRTSADILRWRRDVRRDQTNDPKWPGLRPAQLAVARDWPKRRRGELTAEEIDWINRGIRWEWIRRGIVATVVLVVTLLAGIAWWQRYEADRSRQQVKTDFSRSDFIRAADLLDRDQTADAVAYLARAVETWPENHAAADRIFNLLTQRRFFLPLTELLKVQGEVGAVHFTPEGVCLVALVNGNTVQVWNVLAQRACFPSLVHNSPVRKVQFSEDGKLLAAACGTSEDDIGGGNAAKPGGYAQLWDAQTGKPAAGPLLHGGAVWSLCFNKSGDRIVTASEDKTARIWDTGSGKQIGDAIKHTDPVLTAEFSADGKRVFTASGELQVWDAETRGAHV
jgi:hypothetical protein